MNFIDEIGYKYPNLDVAGLRILLLTAAMPGLSIRDTADILAMSAKSVQLKVTLMGQGRPNRRSSRMGLIVNERNLGDKRKRSLALTDAGEELAELLRPVLAAAF